MNSDNDERPVENDVEEEEKKELIDRRNFLRGLGKWSLAVIGCVAAGAMAAPKAAQTAWVNRRGYGGGGAWANRAGGGGAWINGGGGWINRGGSWINGRGGGGSWVNRRGY